MTHRSAPPFLVLHALRIKGFAAVDVLTEMTALAADVVEAELRALQEVEHALFREARKLWQLTPAGKAHHLEVLHAEVAASGARDAVHEHYPAFLELNHEFKELCGAWQLRPGPGHGVPNDHTDPAYDAEVIARLRDLDRRAQPVCAGFASAMARFGPYGPRLAEQAARVSAGEHKQFTGVMCGSYHDVWMELHEDLILTLGIDRSAEGSF